jgi:Family of unknown function (DUF6932)
MIPPFDDRGYLPSGIHPATLEEVDARFGRESELRRVEVQSLRWLVDLAAGTDIGRIILDGSFVTDAIEPNDNDCVLQLGPGFSPDSQAARELVDGLPFLDLQLVEDPEFTLLVEQIFATDRNGVPKGLVELIR